MIVAKRNKLVSEEHYATSVDDKPNMLRCGSHLKNDLHIKWPIMSDRNVATKTKQLLFRHSKTRIHPLRLYREIVIELSSSFYFYQ